MKWPWNKRSQREHEPTEPQFTPEELSTAEAQLRALELLLETIQTGESGKTESGEDDGKSHSDH
jgi:hypothetical protein